MLTNQIFSGPNLYLLRSFKVSSRPADSPQERGDYAEVKNDCVTVQTKVTEEQVANAACHERKKSLKRLVVYVHRMGRFSFSSQLK